MNCSGAGGARRITSEKGTEKGTKGPKGQEGTKPDANGRSSRNGKRVSQRIWETG